MITVITTPHTAEQARQLREWSTGTAAQLFRETLLSNIAFHQAEVGKALISGVANGTQESQAADEEAEKAARFVHALEIFDEITNFAFLATLFMHPPPKIEEPT